MLLVGRSGLMEYNKINVRKEDPIIFIFKLLVFFHLSSPCVVLTFSRPGSRSLSTIA